MGRNEVRMDEVERVALICEQADERLLTQRRMMEEARSALVNRIVEITAEMGELEIGKARALWSLTTQEKRVLNELSEKKRLTRNALSSPSRIP